MGDADLGASLLRPGVLRHRGRAAWVAALAGPAAVGIAAISVVLCAGAVALLWLAPAHHAYGYDVSGDLVVGCLFPLAGALIAVREPGNRCAWVLLSAGLVAVSAFSHEWAYDGLARPGLLPFVPVATWLAGWTFAPYWLQATLLPVLFPDGTVPSRRWRRFVAGVLIAVAVVTVVAMFKPDPDVEGLGVRNPLGIGPEHVGYAWRFLLLGPVLLLAREEERRRLRRDLHDGLGPELAGMALQLDSLASNLRTHPGLAERAIRLRDRLQHTVTEVRRIVEGLRPSAVDELGLAEALRQLAAAGADLEFAVRVPATLGDLPAAVEVAAYRIAAEACTNVIRHAQASRCSIEAGIQDGWLILTVADNGTGFGTGAAVGVGLQSLHDRAAEVGGSLEIHSAPGGTTVSSRLPLAAG